jgi:hypothetical protein
MTITLLTVVIAVLVLALALFALRAIPGVQAYCKLRGQRLVTCPQTQSAAAVEVAATEAALGAFVNAPTLRLKHCSGWPERQNCLEQIEADPRHCLVWNIARKWYEGKSCVFCHKPIAELRHLDHVPALLGPDFKTSEWKDVAPRRSVRSASHGAKRIGSPCDAGPREILISPPDGLPGAPHKRGAFDFALWQFPTSATSARSGHPFSFCSAGCRPMRAQGRLRCAATPSSPDCFGALVPGSAFVLRSFRRISGQNSFTTRVSVS